MATPQHHGSLRTTVLFPILPQEGASFQKDVGSEIHVKNTGFFIHVGLPKKHLRAQLIRNRLTHIVPEVNSKAVLLLVKLTSWAWKNIQKSILEKRLERTKGNALFPLSRRHSN
jgi:hypothetical protein